MSLRALALDWGLDGSVGLAFAVLLAAAAFVYLLAAKVGTARDRRRRPWPRGRSFCFLAGLAVLFVDLYSGIGTEADTRLSVHMIEHMVMWVVVAPLLAAGAPLRLAFFALPRAKRRALARWLHARPVSALTGSVGSVSLFTAVLVISHLPAVYGLALRNDYVHEVEHGLYLLTALLISRRSVPRRFTTNAWQRRSCGPDAYRRSRCQPLGAFERPSGVACSTCGPSEPLRKRRRFRIGIALHHCRQTSHDEPTDEYPSRARVPLGARGRGGPSLRRYRRLGPSGAGPLA